jgi:hypothetical protein
LTVASSRFLTTIKKANKNIESVNALEAICEKINNLVLQQETSNAIALGYIAESVRRTGEYTADISENVINYLVEEKHFQKKEKNYDITHKSKYHLFFRNFDIFVIELPIAAPCHWIKFSLMKG